MLVMNSGAFQIFLLGNYQKASSVERQHRIDNKQGFYENRSIKDVHSSIGNVGIHIVGRW